MWKMVRRQVIRARKELDPRSLYIRRMDLVIEGYSEDPLVGRCCGRIASATRMGTVYPTPWSLNSVKGRSFGLSCTEMTVSSTG